MDIDLDMDGDYEADYGDMGDDMSADSSYGRSASYGYEDGEDGDLELEYDDDQMEVDPSEDGRNVNFSHSEGEDEEEKEAEHDHVWSRSFTRPSVENRHRPRNRQPESIGDILRRVLGMKKKKREERAEGHVPDEQLDWMQEDYEEYLEEGDDIDLTLEDEESDLQ